MERFSWLALLTAEIGDIIEIQRKGGFSHWGIYAGKDKNEREWIYNMQVYPAAGKNANAKVSVVKSELEKVLEGNLCRVNNFERHFCTKGKSPQDQNDVIKDATGMIAQDFKYDGQKYNAEYYVTQCKFGRGNGFSGQGIESLLAPKRHKLGKKLGARGMMKREREKLAQELYGKADGKITK
ncbi:Retinoic acid receptor responder protein 3 [Folsomia candida]|uniref:Retinoic acid receptor responder protein 3 n=1 Tax=Folsomia candida TaxID=158441 RepID=A0A226D088_FOLCA|nr:Retinoic acid receptor responder protein 3 [Folsomia candida]